MINFIKKNKVFSLALLASVVSGLAFIYGIGFLKMVKSVDPLPERLRNQTFPIWDHQPLAKHGFLVFCTAQDFGNRIAYPGHAPIYLLAMYQFYKMEILNNKFLMRAVVPTFAMLLCLYSIICVGISRKTEKINMHQGTLLILSVVAFMTTPAWWISAGKANVDNVFLFILPLYICAGFILSNTKISFPNLCVTLAAICLIAPMYGFLISFFLTIWELTEKEKNTSILKISIVTLAISFLLFLMPHVVAKFLGFTSVSSSWGFRSGLDGDCTYFSNAFSAIFLPFTVRPVSYLLWPLCLMVAQLLFIWKTKQNIQYDNLLNARVFDTKKFFSIIFSGYVLTVLFWPQSVSIHPYLYDILLLGGISTWIIFNFNNYICFSEKPLGWAFLTLFLISFNIQKIAQAAHAPLSCIFPP